MVHEAETQRQHARYKLPLKVFFQGKVYKVADWSVGGIGIGGVDFDLPVGSVVPFRILFPFDSYELMLSVDGEIRYIDPAKQRAGVKFVKVTPRQSNVMRYLVDALLAGEIVEAGDIIEVTARKFEAVSRQVPQRPPARTRLGAAKRYVAKALAYGLILLVGAAIFDFLVSGAYEKLFTVAARSAAVAGDIVVLAAPVAGQLALTVKGGVVARGAPIFEVAEQPNSKVAVPSPCDCSILKIAASDGTYVRAGEAVVTLVPKSSRQFVSALVDPNLVMRLYPGASVRLQYVDGTVVEPAKIIRMPPALGSNGVATTDLVPVEIDPGRPLAADSIGQPVAVLFNTFDQSWLGHLLAFNQGPRPEDQSADRTGALGRL